MRPMDIPEVDPATAAGHLTTGDAIFVDVRDPASYAESHVPGALHLTDASIRDFLEETDRSAKVIVYCYHGNSSRGGVAYLMEHGFQDVSSMSGGFEAWRGAHPEERG